MPKRWTGAGGGGGRNGGGGGFRRNQSHTSTGREEPTNGFVEKKLRREVPALNFNLNGSGAKSTKPKPKFYSVMRPIELITMMFLQDSIVRVKVLI